MLNFPIRSLQEGEEQVRVRKNLIDDFFFSVCEIIFCGMLGGVKAHA